MAHLLPNLMPSIDRQYTLRYLQGHTRIRNGVEGEWLLTKEILSQFFHPISCNPSFSARALQWASDQETFPRDTSILKIIDNLIIGAIRLPTTQPSMCNFPLPRPGQGFSIEDENARQVIHEIAELCLFKARLEGITTKPGRYIMDISLTSSRKRG